MRLAGGGRGFEPSVPQDKRRLGTALFASAAPHVPPEMSRGVTDGIGPCTEPVQLVTHFCGDCAAAEALIMTINAIIKTADWAHAFSPSALVVCFENGRAVSG